MSITFGVLLGTQVVAQSGRGVLNPEDGLSDDQRAAMHQQAHDKNDQYLRDFVAGHGDPRTLPVIEVESYGGVPATLEAAREAAVVVVEGRVVDVEFAVSPSGGLPLATASVSTLKCLRGTCPETVVLHQLGGPVAQGDGGAIAELDVDPLVLPGDHILLLLTEDKSVGGFRTVPGSGVMVIANDGTVTIGDSSPVGDQINGKSLATVVGLLSLP